MKHVAFKQIKRVAEFLMFWFPCKTAFSLHLWVCKKLDRQQVTKVVIV